MIKIPVPEDFPVGSGPLPSGPIQIGEDWPGTFFRGDASGAYCGMCLIVARALRVSPTERSINTAVMLLEELAGMFEQCQVKL